MSLSCDQEQTLIDKIIEMARNSHVVLGLDYFEKEETRNIMKKYEEDIKKSIEKIKSCLDDEGNKELDNLIDISEQLDNIRNENSFNNGVRSGLDNLAFLKDYFSIF